MEGDYWQAADKLKDDTERMMQDTDPSTFTQMFKTRLRLQKQPNAAMPTRGNEYGNYERFEQNTITEESD